ncbi:MAG: hypothetical protein HYZ28_26025 [Myxococcales bacterium]|nr:hypothetical protein [Myxococcales bacterium]
MSLLPDTASFEERVQDCFLAYRGAGVMLSPLDVELVEAWAKLDVPFEVFARGIRLAAEAALWDAARGQGGLRSLRACERQVEVEVKKFLGRTAGRTAEAGRKTDPPQLFRHKKLLAGLRKLAREQPAAAACVGRLIESALSAPPFDLAETSAREERVYAALLRALPFGERLGVLRQAAELAAGSGAISVRARKLARRLHRTAALRRHLALPAFW